MIKNLAIGSGSNRLLLIFALVLGLLCAILIGVYLSSLNGNSTTSSTVATVPVVVAARDIPAATEVTADMLVVKAVPADLVLNGAFRKTEDAVGQTTQVQILTGEQVVPSKVASAASATTNFGPNPPLSVILQAGQRAYSIGISTVATAGGLVRPGDHVDVLMTTDGGTGDQGQQLASSSCYVVQNVEVLAMNQTLAQTTSDTDANGIAKVANDPGASTMTLNVTPAQAGILASAVAGSNNGLTVALRNFTDHAAASDVPTCNLTAANPPA